jgi:hypothetical protein
MPVALFATIFSAVAAAGMYAFKKQAAQRLEEDERVIERLDSIALRDAIVAPDQRLFVASANVDGTHRPD